MNPRSASRGFTLTELVIALGLLAAAGAVMAPLIFSAAAQRHAAAQRQWALILAESRLDELLTQPWDALTPQESASFVAVEPSRAANLPVALPGLEERIAIIDRSDDAARQVVVEIRWRNRAGDFTAPVRIAGWMFASEGETP